MTAKPTRTITVMKIPLKRFNFVLCRAWSPCSLLSSCPVSGRLPGSGSVSCPPPAAWFTNGCSGSFSVDILNWYRRTEGVTCQPLHALGTRKPTPNIVGGVIAELDQNIFSARHSVHDSVYDQFWIVRCSSVLILFEPVMQELYWSLRLNMQMSLLSLPVIYALKLVSGQVCI